MRGWRARNREALAAEGAPSTPATPVELRGELTSSPALDLAADPGAVEQALAKDLNAPESEVLWVETLLAMARLNARVMDQVHVSERLDLISPLQLRMLEILNRMAFAKTSGLLGGAGAPATSAGSQDGPTDEERARELLDSLDGADG